ncbi:ABC transporter, ATP-binding protein [Leptospira ryugenii]|uniref:ABC transporter, ATP-binding protein n=1 Tax=Leptospira ryugenii TaxID=1917863 RepID=A0A2P2E4G5_9LEPT|nr:ATP-binding cassette domain-containing protein [Leptospira ryugenii]GBF51778.1 ABC transporter, ATP-binding protein [Leptospira ryugenii]
MSANKPIIHFEQVYLTRNDHHILENISFQVKRGESLAILGRNGAGKSSIINLLFAYLWPTAGRIFVLGEEYGTVPLQPIQKKIGILQANHQEQLVQRGLSCLEVLATGLHQTLGLYKEITEEESFIARNLLQSFSMLEKKDQTYHSLSSGEKTKVLLLRAFVGDREILVLDEPTAALDLRARIDFEKNLKEIKSFQPNITRILITHRLEEIPPDFQQVLLLKEGRLLAFGEKEKILQGAILSELYDIGLGVEERQGRFYTYLL